MEKGRCVFRQDRDARLRLEPLGDQAVGDLVGAPVKLGEGNVPSFIVDGGVIRPSGDVVAGNVADRSYGRDAFGLAHDRSSP